ncbi:MAG TPA: hypothetical protein VMZ69_01520 [Saprospiraceae bacterium]|nr:hypothetical protein [Saprospiraceae bacterium]
MKTFQTIFSLLVVLLISTVAFSQPVDMAISSPAKPTKFSLTVTQGVSVSNTANDLVKGMENSGLGDRTPDVYNPGFWFIFYFPGYTTRGEDYPKKKQTNAFYKFKARYDLTPKTAVAINWSTSMNATVEGHDRFGQQSGNFLTLESKVKILTVDYILRTGKGWSGLEAGPAIAFHTVDQTVSNNVNPYHHKGIKPGIHLGYNLSIIKSSTWIVAANVQYNWFLKDKVGPITIEDEITSVYKTQSVGLSNLGLGITAGFKF